VCSLGVEIVGGKGRRPERSEFNFTGIFADSRSVKPGGAFFALPGARCDGHDFVAEALAKGAAAAVVSHDVAIPQEHRSRLIFVEDTLQSLGDSARAYRRNCGGKIIAVTGSNGKTTTREMIHHILAQEMACKRSPRNYNTDIGLPLTLFKAEATDRVMVVEMGANAPGEIQRLAAIAEPDIAVITNIGRSHLEGFGSVDGVARAKSELLGGIKRGGTAFLNADDTRFDFLKSVCESKVISYGFDKRAQFRGRGLRLNGSGSAFVVGNNTRVRLPVPGKHNAQNALAALAVARHFGVLLSDAAERIGAVELPEMRFQIKRIHGVTVISDCYNANPDSVCAALETFGRLSTRGRRAAVLGDMLELGPDSRNLHNAIGAATARAGVEALWAVGECSQWVSSGAQEHGFEGPVSHASRLEDVTGEVFNFLRPGDALLVKGSRGMRMEALVEEIGNRSA